MTGPEYAQNHHRVLRQTEIEDAISSWTSTKTVDEVISTMQKAGVPVGRVNSIKEVVEGDQAKSRGAVEDVFVSGRYGGQGWNVKMPRVFPILQGCEEEARTRWAGPDLGTHTDDVLHMLEISEEEMRKLRADGIVG
jgi:crotonobetainyl-CoA:carnitine CoA-transferase CaiB-like acyl-CoA transferase